MPFATVVATPSVFSRDMGPKQRRYAGFHELAYLHPDEFTPDPATLAALDLSPEDRYFIVRFVAWKATHDIGQHGFSLEQKRTLLRELSAQGRVLLSVEDMVEPEFEPYLAHFAPDKIHDLLAYATLYVGEGATMATESAVLGTPSVYVSTLEMGNFLDLQNNYELLYWTRHGATALEHVREILALPDPRQTWAARHAKLLVEKIDLTPWLVDLCQQFL
jgi:predicted glycosyltransferase